MTKIKKAIGLIKLNKNKKGFSLVELLCTVAIIAIVTPMLVSGFITAAKLNTRSRLQQRVDAAANSVYEDIAALDYKDLEGYFSDTTVWTNLKNDGVDDGSELENGYAYYCEKIYDDIDDCTVTVSVEKFTTKYLVPDINIVGVQSSYLTLESEVNRYDELALSKIEQSIKKNVDIKKEITRNQLPGDILPDNIGVLNLEPDLSEENIYKRLKANVKKLGDKLVATYTVEYVYPDLIIPYSYTYKEGDKWTEKDGSYWYTDGEDYDLDGHFDDYVYSVATGVTKQIDLTNSATGENLYIYYNPYSTNDSITIIPEFDGLNVYIIEQIEGEPSEENFVLNWNNITNDNHNYENNVSDYIVVKPFSDSTYTYKLYSNNNTFVEEGLPQTVYQSGTRDAELFRIEVIVTHESELFDVITGTFSANREVEPNED